MGPSFLKPQRIAIIEDDQAVRAAVADLLQSAGFETDAYGSVDAYERAEKRTCDLFILDLQLPGCDGLSFAGRLRATSRLPIIMLTGRGDEVDRVVGLEIGADDYVVKPFNNRELLARVKAMLRRSAPSSWPAEPVIRNGYRFGDFRLDLNQRRLETDTGEAVSLTVAEFDLLVVLMAAKGRVMNREQLLAATHRRDADVFDRTIDVLILRLRRKIEPSRDHPRFIRTERGHGYVFDGPIEVIGQP